MEATSTAPLVDTIAPEAARRPIYRVGKRSPVNAIESGRCAPGNCLPSEARICEAMGVSIDRLRRAVDELAVDHILVRCQGRGTFVTTHRSSRALGQSIPVDRSKGLRGAPTEALLSFERPRVADAPVHAFERARTGSAQRQAARGLGGAVGRPAMQVRRTAPTFGDRPAKHRLRVIDTARHAHASEQAQPVRRRD